jgi:polysaccharide export outer membrane protein
MIPTIPHSSANSAYKLSALCVKVFLSISTIAALALPAVAQFNGPATSGRIPLPTSAPAATLTTDRAILFPTSHDQFLQPGDILVIHLFDQPDYNPTVRVANDGSVQLPLIGRVELNGLTISQSETLIAHRLESAGMYVNPQITIQYTEGPNAVVTVIGETHGVVPVAGSRRLLDVISAAGGLPPTASHVITINRPGAAQPIVVDLGSDPLQSDLANIPVFPGDTIVVGRVGVVYVLGEFKTAGAVPLTPYTQLTLTQAASLAGGVNFAGKLTDLHLIRTVGDHRTVVKLDVGAIFEGKAPDPILQPNDILYLPSSALKIAIQQGGLGAILSAASLAVTAIAVTRQ